MREMLAYYEQLASIEHKCFYVSRMYRYIVKRKIAKLKLYDEHDGAFLDENLQQAKLIGDRVLTKALRKVQRKLQLKKALKLMDESFFGGAFLKAKRRI